MIFFVLQRFLERAVNMATKQEVSDAIAAEKAQVQAALSAQDAKIAELQARLDAGGAVTAADLDELKAAVEAIYTPAA